MTWRDSDPQGNEAAKVRHELVPYIRGRCLDIGCGGEKVWPHFVGVDNFADAKLFGSQINADINIETAEDLRLFGSREFDCVFSSHLLEHMVNYKQALREWWRLVRPGGTLILYVPHRDHYPRIGQPGANPDHKHDFEPDDIVAAMTKLDDWGWDLERNEVRSGGFEYSFLQVWRKRTDKMHLQSWKYPRPDKTCAVVRLGALGDALWASSVIAPLKAEGYHVTVYTQEAGELMLRNDPHVDKFIIVPQGLYDAAGLISYFIYESKKYDRFVNLVGVVETRLLPAPTDVEFWRTDEQRHRMFNRNYLEALHEAAGVPPPYAQKFYATGEEINRARARRAKFSGRVVVIAPNGSTIAKHWPHTQALIDALAAQEIHGVVVGDLRHESLHATDGFGAVVGLDWPVREALAFAQIADAVVGVESAVLNAVAMEPVLKVVLLSHSSHENLTKHWTNVLPVEPVAVKCHPCHRIHRTMEHCTVDPQTQTSACMAFVTADAIAEALGDVLAAQAQAEKVSA
jgi:ADP-heptose:LPS heptosyltransferase/predicted SAM-dependent methyltransferase